MKVLYLIQGLFYQRGVSFDFSAFLFLNPQNSVGELMGSGCDQYGIFKLSNIIIQESEASFTKKYLSENVEIKYKLKKENGYWVGTWSRPDASRGNVRCMLTETPEGFLTL